ncbi:MAG: helix-turn-helix domain-containing protein [Aliidongia sp.]
MRPLFAADVPEKAIDRFYASLRIARFDCCLVGRLSGVRQRLARTTGLPAASGLKQILVLACSLGTATIEAEGRVTHLAAGDIAILDLARAATCEWSEFRCMVLLLPRDRVAEILAAGSVHGLVMPARSVLAMAMRVLLAFMTRMANLLAPADAEDLLSVALLLLKRGLRVSRESAVASRMPPGAASRLAVQDYIEAHLTDEHLSPKRLAKIFRMSRATLYRLFKADDGGVAALIRARRLDRCFQELARGSPRTRVGDIAFSYGFGSEALFSRIFRQRFGISPREARGTLPASDARDAPEAEDDARRLHRWLDDLNGPIVTRHRVLSPLEA